MLNELSAVKTAADSRLTDGLGANCRELIPTFEISNVVIFPRLPEAAAPFVAPSRLASRRLPKKTGSLTRFKQHALNVHGWLHQ